MQIDVHDVLEAVEALDPKARTLLERVHADPFLHLGHLAEELGVDRATLSRWKKKPEFEQAQFLMHSRPILQLMRLHELSIQKLLEVLEMDAATALERFEMKPADLNDLQIAVARTMLVPLLQSGAVAKMVESAHREARRQLATAPQRRPVAELSREEALERLQELGME